MDLDQPRPTKPAPAKKSNIPAIIGGIVLFLLLCCCGIFAFNNLFTRDKTATVESYSWERTVEVEAYGTVTEEDWDVPSGGRILSQREEIREYDQVLVGYETKSRQVSEQVQTGSNTYVCGSRDLGNGFFEDVMCTDPVYETQYSTEYYEDPIYNAVPVYDTLYTYDIDKWSVVRTERSAANHNEPFWPSLSLASDEREGARTEKYELVFVDEDGNRYPMELPYEEWAAFESGREYTITVNGAGEVVGVE
jgi:hypothetical protein